MQVTNRHSALDAESPLSIDYL